jgi:hypothetical protein
MPDWSDLSAEQVTGILDWFEADGPEHQKPLEERNADEADASDVEAGRRAFSGETKLASGGLACAGCHALARPSGWAVGASFGPDLSNAYFRYGDRALTAYLGHPCFARVPDLAASRYLSAEEVFALKAFLRRVASGQAKGSSP